MSHSPANSTANRIDDVRITDGDVFRWSYADPERHKNYLSYWAKSQVAVANNGILSDTFWIGDNASWTYEEAALSLNLEHLGNLSHFQKVEEWKRGYYAPSDYLDLNHSNSSKGNFYLRIGAQRSKAAMKEAASRQLMNAEQDLLFSQRAVERYQSILSDLEKDDARLDDISL